MSVSNFIQFFRCEFDNIGGTRLIERVKFNILEIQENLENYADKKELMLEVKK